MNIQDRYTVEHELLPDAFFSETKRFIPLLLKKRGTTIVNMYRYLNRDNQGYQCPYDKDDFKLNTFFIASKPGQQPDCCIIQICMPKPESIPLCHRVYICYNESMEQVAYYTIERSFDDSLVLCAWNKETTHLNFGPAPQKKDEEIQQVMDYFLKGYSNFKPI